MPNVDDQVPGRKPVGRFEAVFSKLFTKAATLRDARNVANDFRLLTFTGEALKNVAWVPGQKLQVVLGGWVQRTYTPLSWDAARGVTEVLAYMHGAFPGSAWARGIQPGDTCSLFGPRGSLDLNALERPGVLFGDETSFGLAHALRHTARGAAPVRLLFEVTEREPANAALAAIGISDAQLVTRQANDAHLAELERLAAELARDDAPRGWVLSGRAPAIQRLTRRLRELDVPRSKIQTKAYWAPGKTGLD